MASDDYPRRRRSIFGGLLLILVGVLFLIHSFHGNFPIWRLLERWWPLVFILWGVAKLYDHFVAQHTGEVAPPTVTAGEIVLVLVLLVVIGGARIVEWGTHRATRSEIFFPWEESYSFAENVAPVTVPANARITVNTSRGSLMITGDDTPQIRVSARKAANASSENIAQDRANAVHVAITPNGSNGFLIEPQGQNGSEGAVSVEMEVHVPKGASLSVTTNHGDIDISGISGTINAEGRGGETSIRQSGSDVSVTSHSGDVRVIGANGNVTVSGRGTQVEISDVKGAATIDGEFYGPLSFSQVAKGVHFVSNRSDVSVTELPGRMELPSPGDMTISDTQGNVTLTTTKRDLSLVDVSGKIQVDNRSGNISVRFSQPPKESVDLTTQNGDIDLTLPARSNFDVTARADRGDLNSDFPELEPKIGSDHGNSRLDASVGSHGPAIQLRSTYGSIHIHKGQ
jgi:DUF4097 and DUF4098 domain-containing protein YvlB